MVLSLVEPLPLAVRDYGGAGPDVLLLHGGGRQHSDFDAFAGMLVRAGFHAVAMDLRGHGRSGPGEWSWPAAVDDVETAMAHASLRDPVIIGHSLGGMVAALWASGHPRCPLAVNVDGHGNPTNPDRLLGLTGPGAAAAMRSFRDQLAGMGAGLSPAMLGVMAQIDALDLFGVYRAAVCPLLVVSGRQTRDFEWLFDEPGASAWRAGRAWTMRQLQLVSAEHPLVATAELDTGHDAHREDPAALLELVTAHLDTV